MQNASHGLPKKSKQEYDDTPMSTKEWKEVVLKD